MAFKDIEMKKLLPVGINTVDHSKRVSLGIDCTDYCVLETIIKRKQRNKDVTFVSIENYTQIDTNDIDRALSNLKSLNIIKEVSGKILLNMKIIEKMDAVDNKKYEKEFDEFWHLPEDFKYNIWPGVKKKSYINFVKARKKHSFDFIINQRSDYIELLRAQPFRTMMVATRFLNVDTGEIETDYGAEVRAILPEERPKANERITLEDKKKEYEE